MVTLKQFDSKIREMIKFYVELPNYVESPADREHAILAKDASERILDLIVKYYSDPKDTYLRQIEANVATLTRGVEGFQDKAVQQRHKGYGSLRHELTEFIRAEIRR